MQFCLAHLIREVKFLLTLPDWVTRNYGERLLDKLRQLFRVIHRREKMTPEQFQRALERCRKAVLKMGLTKFGADRRQKPDVVSTSRTESGRGTRRKGVG